ncbi:MAG: non-canonical purine NTP pyrophosphatase [Candidatus Dormibacter sp.]|uniref:non-canonical purine NTP pyrophosphatase n=1 Tax=Candidatus Dormibacter sp. TaxID=2973982 RepID=UPI000DB2BC07|nr:MAG: non-canonical purine NTP pyrophosphatase [Candidatus Dormibacteraeota bacterium]
MTVLFLATGNAGKLGEFQELLLGTGLTLEAVDTRVPETGDSYGANAALKAEAATRSRAGPALGDDSGLEVAALGGYPGLLSARIAPTQAEREALLLERLRHHPRPWRARFVCLLALSVPGRQTLSFSGEAAGEIREPAGRGHGFGYDPVFWPSGSRLSLAELPPIEKHRLSHRGAAVRALLASGALATLGRPSERGESRR